MSQINANFQELITTNNNNNNANTLDNVAGTTLITSEALQQFSMANQFAICANSGSGPVILSCLTPMLLPTLASTSKANFDMSNQDNRGQNSNHSMVQPQTVQIQLASPFSLTNNLCSSNNAQSLPSLGLSYINLSSLGNTGNAFPIQITLNNANSNQQQITIPTATLNNINQELQMSFSQIAQNYQIGSQVKFEPDLSGGQQQSQQQQQQQQQSITNNRVMDISDNSNLDDKSKRKPRRRIPNKAPKLPNTLANGGDNNNGVQNQPNNQEERLLDHKGRPFIYNCPNCPKKFTLNSRLTAHLRCHTGIRPYTCVQCGFSFTQKSYLIRHAAVHTEERPFTCERCLKTYKHYGSLANHRKLHRKEDKNGTSDISESNCQSDQKPACDNNVVTTTTLVDQTNLDNILHLHSDWSTVASSISDNSTYLIANNTKSDTPNIAYYSQSSNGNVSQVLAGSGPVAFPDQQMNNNSNNNNGLDNVVSSNQQSLMECSQVAFCTNQSSDINNSHIKNSSQSVFLDTHNLQIFPSSSSSSNQNQTHSTTDPTNIYTHVEIGPDQHQHHQQLQQHQQQQQQPHPSTNQLQQPQNNNPQQQTHKYKSTPNI